MSINKKCRNSVVNIAAKQTGKMVLELEHTGRGIVKQRGFIDKTFKRRIFRNCDRHQLTKRLQRLNYKSGSYFDDIFIS